MSAAPGAAGTRGRCRLSPSMIHDCNTGGGSRPGTAARSNSGWVAVRVAAAGGNRRVPPLNFFMATWTQTGRASANRWSLAESSRWSRAGSLEQRQRRACGGRGMCSGLPHLSHAVLILAAIVHLPMARSRLRARPHDSHSDVRGWQCLPSRAGLASFMCIEPAMDGPPDRRSPRIMFASGPSRPETSDLDYE